MHEKHQEPIPTKKVVSMGGNVSPSTKQHPDFDLYGMMKKDYDRMVKEDKAETDRKKQKRKAKNKTAKKARKR